MLEVFAAIFAGNVLSVLCAALLLLASEEKQARLMPWLLNFATGTLLCAGFAGMLPNALRQAPPESVMFSLLAGILFFFILERTLLWRHCHNRNCEIHSAAGHIIIIGDSVHNFMDGIAIAAAFSHSSALGIGTAVAVFAHELPQEVGDFAILLNSGFSKARAFFWNLVSGLSALVGGLLAYAAIGSLKAAVPYAMAFAASSLIYVAMADLIPSLRNPQKTGFRHFAALLAGIALMLVFILRK